MIVLLPNHSQMLSPEDLSLFARNLARQYLVDAATNQQKEWSIQAVLVNPYGTTRGTAICSQQIKAFFSQAPMWHSELEQEISDHISKGLTEAN